MARRFRFTETNQQQAKEALSAKETASTEESPALEWTPEQLEAMSKTTADDLQETRNWLERTGQDDAAAMFDAE